MYIYKPTNSSREHRTIRFRFPCPGATKNAHSSVCFTDCRFSARRERLGAPEARPRLWKAMEKPVVLMGKGSRNGGFLTSMLD